MSIIPLHYTNRYTRIETPQDDRALGDILVRSFHQLSDYWPAYRDRVGRHNFRLIKQNDTVLGGCAVYNMGQWFGGRRLPLRGVAAVGVAPEYRGRGVALQLLHHVVRECAADGVPLSALYPAVPQLYQKVGYERAGLHCRWQLPLKAIAPGSRSLPVYRVDRDRSEPFETVYRQFARDRNGYLDRPAALWQNILGAEDDPVVADCIGDRDDPQGYIIYTVDRRDGQTLLDVRDWAATTPEAVRRLWTFAADHRAQIGAMSWWGTGVEPWLSLVDDRSATIATQKIWDLRIVNAATALSDRPYPPVTTELHFHIRDDLLAANNGKIILVVTNGTGETISGGRGELQLNIRGLASLYTGLISARSLQHIGFLKGSDRAIATADLLFCGPVPGMPDFF